MNDKNKEFEEWKERLKSLLIPKGLKLTHNNFVYYWNNNLSVDDVILIHEAEELSEKGREVFQNAKRCGCFYCLNFFDLDKIVWNDNLPLCPYCRIDSVLPDLDNYPLSEELLSKLNDLLFVESRDIGQ